MDEELAHESEMASMGVAAYRLRVDRQNAKGLASQSEPGKRLISRCVEPVSAGLTTFINDSFTTPGRHASATKYLKEVDADVAALVTAQAMFDGVATSAWLQGVAHQIGKGIEDEVRLDWIDQESGPVLPHAPVPPTSTN